MKKIKLISLIACSLLIFSSCTKKNNDIQVGVFGGLTGNDATYGQSMDKGIRLAVEEVNSSGGVKGRKINLTVLDNQGKADETASVVTRLVTQNNVVALLGDFASVRSLVAAPIAQQNKIPMISPGATNPKVTQVGDYIFRVCFIDPFQGFVMAKFAIENLKLKKAAVLRDIKNDYSVGLADVFVTEFKKMGGEIVIDSSYQANDVDFKGQLTEIKAKNPDVLFIPGFYTEVGLIAQQARQLGITAPMIGGDGWDSTKLNEIGKEAVNGSYFSNHYTTESSEPIVLDFIKKYKTKYNNETPDAVAALGYDAAKALIQVMNKIDDITPEKIKTEFAQLKDFNGVTGKISMNNERNAVKSAVVVQVENEKRKYVATVAP